MKLVLHDNKLYSAVTPSAYMFHSTMIREVYSRGDFLAVDLMTGDMTVIPGRAQHTLRCTHVRHCNRLRARRLADR